MRVRGRARVRVRGRVRVRSRLPELLPTRRTMSSMPATGTESVNTWLGLGFGFGFGLREGEG